MFGCPWNGMEIPRFHQTQIWSFIHFWDGIEIHSIQYFTNDKNTLVKNTNSCWFTFFMVTLLPLFFFIHRFFWQSIAFSRSSSPMDFLFQSVEGWFTLFTIHFLSVFTRDCRFRNPHESLNLSFNPISLASTDPSFPAGSNPSLLLPQTLTENDVFAKNDAAMGKSDAAIGPIFSLVCTEEEERWYMAAGNWCCDLGRWRQGKWEEEGEVRS